MYYHSKKRRTNINILTKTIKEVAKDENIVEKTKKDNVGYIPKEPEKTKPKPSKREITMDGNGIIEKQLTKKGLEFINFKNLLTG